jgi:hypothetical protein
VPDFNVVFALSWPNVGEPIVARDFGVVALARGVILSAAPTDW